MCSFEVGFIGAGEMAKALICGFLTEVDSNSIIASSPSGAKKLEDLGIYCTSSNAEVFRTTKIVFLCCKPTQVADILQECGDICGKLVL